ncbi:MAG: hypothetical protein ACD_75C02335G0003 [uncultured bacterium]|nr:MAG: hypothetical protein ACD_75C02335G0003 [uncultured bacterium]
MTMPRAASSSSAWRIATLRLPVSFSTRNFAAYFSKASTMEVDGVIGYQPATVAPA